MKKIATTSALMMLGAALTLGAFAQTPKAGKVGKPGAAARKEARGMKRFGSLSLTDEQKAKVKSLREAADTKRKGIESDKSLTADAKKTKLKEIGKDFRADVEKILTPEQKKKMDDMRKERKAKAESGAGKPVSSTANAPAPKKP